MIKKILFLAAILFANIGFTQFLSSGTLTTDSKYRSGGLGLGFTSTPTFGTNKFMVTGNSSFIGNLGIGMTTPAASLDVFGTIKFGALSLSNTAPRFLMSDANGNLSYRPAASLPNFNCANPNFLTKTDVNGNFVCSNISDSGNLINIGILPTYYNGGTEPTNNGINLNSTTSIFGSLYTNQIYCISKSHDDLLWFINNQKLGESRNWRLGSTTPHTYFGTKNGFTIFEGDSPNQTRFFIEDGTGKVSVGTNNIPLTAGTVNVANYKLFVTGGILTEEVRVNLRGTNGLWADYVFNKDYKLPSLQEVEKQIQEKGHLPNMPSAKEVKENGIELGEMAKMQQEKIEELTLYIIEQNKINEKQNKKIDQLEALVNKLINK